MADDAPRRLREAFAKLRKRARRLTPASPAVDFHQVRIRAKRLRYAAEFFEDAYGKPAKQLAKRAVVIQDLLGDHQDGVVGTQRIREAIQTVAGAWPAEASLALGQVVQFDAQRGAQLREAFPRAYADLTRKGWRPLQRVLSAHH